MTRVETAVKRLSYVNGAAYDPATGEIKVDYTGTMDDVTEIRNIIDRQGVACEAVNPMRVVVRPIGQVSKPAVVLAAVRKVKGVLAAEKDGSDFIVYSDASTLSLAGLVNAARDVGVKCRIPSHEEFEFTLGRVGSVEALKEDLARTKWVLRADVHASAKTIVFLCVKGRVSRAALRTIAEKHGFFEAK